MSAIKKTEYHVESYDGFQITMTFRHSPSKGELKRNLKHIMRTYGLKKASVHDVVPGGAGYFMTPIVQIGVTH